MAGFTIGLSEPVRFTTYQQYAGESESGLPMTKLFRQCEFGTLNYVKFSIQGSSIIFGLLLSFLTRDIPGAFGEGVWMYSRSKLISRSRCMLNYFGNFVAFSINLLGFSNPPLVVRICSQFGGVIGAQGITVLFMVVPKLYVKNVKIVTTIRESITTITPPELTYIQAKPLKIKI